MKPVATKIKVEVRIGEKIGIMVMLGAALGLAAGIIFGLLPLGFLSNSISQPSLIIKQPVFSQTESGTGGISSSLVLYYGFNEGVEGSADGQRTIDSSGYGNNGLIYGASWVSGKSGFALLFDGSGDYVDAGNNESLNLSSAQYLTQSPNVGVHQGVATDGNYFYLFHTNFIKKTDVNWNEIIVNANVANESGNNHIGDGDYYDGKLYVATDDYRTSYCHPDGLNSKISIWDADDLSFIASYDISAQGHEASGVAVDGVSRIVYVTSYCDGSKIWKYSLDDFSYLGVINLSDNLQYAQGVAKHGDYLYVATSVSQKIWRIALDGTVEGAVWSHTSEGIVEGLDYSQDILYYLVDLGAGKEKNVHSLKVRDSLGATVEFWLNAAVLPYQMSNPFMRFIWSANDYFVVFYRQSTGNLEFKLTTEQGSHPRPVVPQSELTANGWMHIAAVYDGASAKLYVNGAEKNSVPRDRTSLIADWHMYIGSLSNTIDGVIDEVRIWNRPLAASEIAAIYNCWSNYSSEVCGDKIDNDCDLLTDCWDIDDCPQRCGVCGSFCPGDYQCYDGKCCIVTDGEWECLSETYY